MYNSWDADMENGKLGDADIKLYEADAPTSAPRSVGIGMALIDDRPSLALSLAASFA